ncbi:MAG: hypothetical protein VX614_07710 [Myxococcota bacterium]|nr:hypothetical protein [Myxococcota bacterium]
MLDLWIPRTASEPGAGPPPPLRRRSGSNLEIRLPGSSRALRDGRWNSRDAAVLAT